MSSGSKEVETYFGRCRCCLSYSYLKNMWTEYYFHGNREIYAEMLEQCYNLSLEQPEESDSDQICEGCVRRLRDALTFRELIIESSNRLGELVVEGRENKIDDEIEDAEAGMNKYEVQIAYDNEDWGVEEKVLIPKVEVIEDQPKEDFVEGSQEHFQILPEISDNNEFGDKYDGKHEEFTVNAEGEIDGVEVDTNGQNEEGGDINVENEGDINGENAYENIEYLEDEVNLPQQDKTNEDDDDYQPKRKWPKKLPRLDRNRRYKQYTEEALRTCLREICNGMSIADACKLYSIPRKTVDKKLKTYDTDKDEEKELTYKFHKEIKSILSFTNATPYKSNIVKYSCIYCLKAVFTDPQELRNHTRTMHTDERTKKVDIFMRPHWENEILKLDIDNLLCVVCCRVVPEWNDMLHHLTVIHNINLDLAYSKVIPYKLSKELKCALCKDSYSNYLQLDGHMNSHYENYMCSDCGDYFLTQSRLKAHQKTHIVGRFPCEICHKVFGQEKYKRKHVNSVHYQTLRYRCAYCDVKFPSEISRQNHLQIEHMDKIKPIHCELCGKVFYWRQYYTAHKKKIHGEKTHVCGQCGKKFSRNYQLQEHLTGHKGEKSVECPICHNKYMTKTSLRVHIMNQHKKKGE
ncbi:hypothetical protein K1T71_014602 [Dendrolimus kikuchii]|uniref:Uncharacterized protein n=1 Tax=Dendrolimus kikuchii TaxID=765133 RepID=A0ACC1CEJ1_9NEOP|nr:hypothetical protein K1T71_014602 [Dendrolimus kikuchii]